MLSVAPGPLRHSAGHHLARALRKMYYCPPEGPPQWQSELLSIDRQLATLNRRRQELETLLNTTPKP